MDTTVFYSCKIHKAYLIAFIFFKINNSAPYSLQRLINGLIPIVLPDVEEAILRRKKLSVKMFSWVFIMFTVTTLMCSCNGLFFYFYFYVNQKVRS